MNPTPFTYRWRLRMALRAALLAWLGFLLLVLAGCGGSTSDDDEDTQRIPTNPLCQQRPEACR